jgi:hypothetical protein
MQMLDADIPYLHSVMDDMASPSSITVPEPTVQDAINSVIQVCHFYTTYAVCGNTDDEDPETPAFSQVRFRPNITDDADKERKKWACQVAMTPTKLVFKK